MTAFSPGQVWLYKTRAGEECSRLLILKLEDDPVFGSLVHIGLTQLNIQNPNAPDGTSSTIEHLPFASAAVLASITRLESDHNSIPPYEEGYGSWRDACDSGEGGVWSCSVSEAVSAMEAVFLSATRPN